MTAKWTPYMQTHPERMFLLDGIGALVTALSLLGIAQLESYFGMPARILHVLAVVVGFYALYSFSCRFFLFGKESFVRIWRTPLLIIASANGLYCVVMAFLLFRFYESLTALGLIYFVMEVSLILLLVWFEVKVATKR